MAKKPVTQFVCSECGARTTSWSGRCAQCGNWNTLQEQLQDVAATLKASGSVLQVQSIRTAAKQESFARLTTAIADVDTVLGGGIVAGSVVLLAGEPGIGKSTLLLQVAAAVAAHHAVLYISGEESEHQVGLRAQRLHATTAQLSLATATSANDIAATIASGDYALVVVDSIQTLQVQEVSSAAGSVSQITNSMQLLTAAAKQSNCALLVVGHVTKEGSIAGPKVLEHSVDVVLQLEGDRYGGFKLLRGVKNRFGSTGETGIFETKESGLFPVENPSAALLAERQITDGSVVHAAMEGSRAVLVEIQALVNTTSYGYPKRTASGFDLNRMNVLLAMLERRTKLSFADKDVFLNVVGGIRLQEPAADLAVVMAIASASKGLQLKKNAVVFGELGLSGEVRHVPYAEKRLSEATKMGFSGAIAPKSTAKASSKAFVVTHVREALNKYLEKDS